MPSLTKDVRASFHAQVCQDRVSMIILLDNQQPLIVRIRQLDQADRQLARWKMPMQFRALQPGTSIDHDRAGIIALRATSGRIHPDEVLFADLRRQPDQQMLIVPRLDQLTAG